MCSNKSLVIKQGSGGGGGCGSGGGGCGGDFSLWQKFVDLGLDHKMQTRFTRAAPLCVCLTNTIINKAIFCFSLCSSIFSF